MERSSLLESLPVELVADILGELDLDSLIIVSYLSHRLHDIASDPALNPWRRPILRNLRSGEYEPSMRCLSLRWTVPRQNWLEILSVASPEFLLYEATLPNLSERDWEECFMRRFLPGWTKWRREGRWREAFLKMLFRVNHRTTSSCTADEAWTKYIVINRNGSANQLDAASRSFDPLVLFNEMKLQSNLMHLETHIRLVVQFTDVRILAFGVLNNPRSTFSINENARAFLHPPGMMKDSKATAESGRGSPTESIDGSMLSFDSNSFRPPIHDYIFETLTHPQPAPSHANYPFYTSGGGDRRWLGAGDYEEHHMHWVGGLLLVAQLVSDRTSVHLGPPDQDFDLVIGPGRSHYASFTWADLDAIAPWMADRITKRIDGQGLGI